MALASWSPRPAQAAPYHFASEVKGRSQGLEKPESSDYTVFPEPFWAVDRWTSADSRTFATAKGGGERGCPPVPGGLGLGSRGTAAFDSEPVPRAFDKWQSKLCRSQAALLLLAADNMLTLTLR